MLNIVLAQPDLTWRKAKLPRDLTYCFHLTYEFAVVYIRPNIILINWEIPRRDIVCRGCDSRLCTIKHDLLILDIRSASDARVHAGCADRHVRKRDGRLLKLLQQRARDISTWTTRRAAQWPLRWFLLKGSASCGWDILTAASEHVRERLRVEKAHPRPRHALCATRNLEHARN